LYEEKTNVHLFKRKGEKGVCVCVYVEEKKKIVHPFPRRKRWREKNKTTQFHPCCKGEITNSSLIPR
jgi:hypothetical protein